MMKRFVCTVMLLVLLTAACASADTPLREYRDVCPHLYWLMTESNLTELEAEGLETIGAMCVYCEKTYELQLPWAPRQELLSQKPELTCEHEFRVDAEIAGEGYYPINQLTPAHEYRYLLTARCVKCVEQIDAYIAPGVAVENFEAHELEKTDVHFHMMDTEQHAFVYRCKDCGYVTASMTRCVMFDIGLCTTTLRELGALPTDIPDWYRTIGNTD